MSYRIVSYVDRPDLDGSWDEVVGPAWPEFLYHDAVCNRLWPHLFDEFADFQFYLLDEEADRVVGQGNSAPFAWNGDPATLPDGVNGVLPLAVEQREAGVAPTTLCALQAVVVPPMQGRGRPVISWRRWGSSRGGMGSPPWSRRSARTARTATR
jgi:hypothetical protein